MRYFKSIINLSVITLITTLMISPAVIGAEYAGFLDDYSGLKPDPDRSGAKIYRKSGVNLGQYDKIIFDPIEIWYHPKTKYKGISPDELKLLADAFRDVITRELEPDYPVVNSPGKGVLRVRLAITNVKMKKKKRGLLGYMPIGAAITALKDVAGKRIVLTDAAIEGELLDSESNDKLAILVDSQASDAGKGKDSWDALEGTLTFYAKRFRQRLDAEH